MQIVKVTESAIDHKHPREAFFRQFPWDVECSTCKSEYVLDSPEDVWYHTDDGYQSLRWRCSYCNQENRLTEHYIFIRGYAAMYPREVWRKDWLFGCIVLSLFLLPFIIGIGTEIFV